MADPVPCLVDSIYQITERNRDISTGSTTFQLDIGTLSTSVYKNHTYSITCIMQTTQACLTVTRDCWYLELCL